MKKTLLSCLSVIIATIAFAQAWLPAQKITPGNRAESNAFGSEVTIVGEYAFMSAPTRSLDSAGLNYLKNAGAVYVYMLKDNEWVQTQMILAPDRGEWDLFGRTGTIATNGTDVMIGAYAQEYDENSKNELYNAGAVYVYGLQKGIWQLKEKLVAPLREENARFGSSISIYGNTAAIGSERCAFVDGDSTKEAGAVYVYEKGEKDTSWSFVSKHYPSTPQVEGKMGETVFIYGDYLVAGARYEDKSEDKTSTGAVYIYKSDNGIWKFIKKLVLDRPVFQDYFGYSIAMNSDYLAVSAILFDGPYSGNGAVFIYELASDSFELIKQITASDPSDGQGFGNAMAMNDEVLVVGASWDKYGKPGSNKLDYGGSVLVFDIKDGWSEVQKLVTDERAESDYFGTDVSLSGNQLLIGAYNEDEDADNNTVKNSGAAYYYYFDKTAGIFENKISNSSTVYPNPVSNVLNIQCSNELGENVIINVYSMSGKPLLQNKVKAYKNKTSIDLSNLSHGVYIVSIKDEQSTYTQRIIKE